MSATVLNPAVVFPRGLRDPEGLTVAERLVFILMEFEALMDMEGWDHFFTSTWSRYYPELKRGLAAAGDLESLEVLEDYEQHLRERNVALEPGAIDAFIVAQSDDYFRECRDWRDDYSELSEQRWRKVREHLGTLGLELQA
jgi:hypothetical protein